MVFHFFPVNLSYVYLFPLLSKDFEYLSESKLTKIILNTTNTQVA